MRVSAALAVLGLIAAPPAGAAQEDRRLFVDEAPEEFLRKVAEAQAKSDWNRLNELHKLAHDGAFARKLCAPDPEAGRYVPLPAVINLRMAALPESARDSLEAVAEELLSAVEERGERFRTASKYSFTRAGRAALEALAARDFEEGRVRDAIRGWSLLLEVSPAPETAARLANAHVAAGDAAALEGLRRREPPDGGITVGGRTTRLRDYLAGLAPPAPPPLLKPAPPRAVPEIRLGELKPEGNMFGPRSSATALPAAVSHEGRDFAIFTNGIKVYAIDPDRASGGTLLDAAAWTWPREGTVRWMPTPRMNPPYPGLGVAAGGRRVFATMFTQTWQARPQQVGRRADSFEGPGALRAFDLVTGELLWDTETIEVESGSEKSPLIETLPFKGRNYAFAGAPIVRDDRVYAAVMSSPMTEREVWILCLNAADGKPRWCSSVGSTSATRETPSIPTFEEHDGTIVVQTNFGIVAALDSRTGATEWLVKHPRETLRTQVSPPAIDGSTVTVLVQDRDAPLCFDRWTGREIPLPKLDVPWAGITRLVGRAGEWIVFAGAKSYAVRLRDAQAVELLDADASRSGRGVVAEGRVYLPIARALQVYDARTWKLLGSWRREGDEVGNLAVAGSRLVSLSDRLEVSTSHAALLESFGDRPKPEACLQLGMILQAAGRPREAEPLYRRALAAWENDPAWQESAETVRKRLQSLDEKPAETPKPEK